MLRRSVEIALCTSGNDRRVFLEKINALLGATLLVKGRPPGFSSEVSDGLEQSSVRAAAVQREVKLLVEVKNPRRIILREQLVVEPFSLAQGGRLKLRQRLLQGRDLQNSPKFAQFSRLPFREDRYRQASIATPHDQATSK